MIKKGFWQYLLFFIFVLLFWILGYFYLGNAKISEDTAYILQCSFFVFPLMISLLAILLSQKLKISILWFSLGLALMNGFFIWTNYFKEHYLLNQVMSDLKAKTQDSIIIGNYSFYRGTLILDCYREDAPEYHFSASNDNDMNYHNYKKSLAAEQIDEYLETVIYDALNINVRLITNSLHMELDEEVEFDSPVKLIEWTRNMNLYCIAKKDASPALIDEVAEVLTPYLWNTDCILMVIYADKPNQMELFSKEFYGALRHQKKIFHD